MAARATAEHASIEENVGDGSKRHLLKLPQEIRDHIYFYLAPEVATVTANRCLRFGIRDTRGPNESVVLNVINWEELRDFHRLYAVSRLVQSDVIKYFQDNVKLEVDCSWYENEYPSTTISVLTRPRNLLPSRFLRGKNAFSMLTFIAIEAITVPDSLWEPIRARVELQFIKSESEDQAASPKFYIDGVKWESQIEARRVDATHAVQHAVTDFESLLAIRLKHLFGKGPPEVPFNPAHKIQVDLTQLTPDLIWHTQKAVAVELNSDYIVTKCGAEKEQEIEWAHVPIKDMIEDYDEEEDDAWFMGSPEDTPADMELHPLGSPRQELQYVGVDEAWKGMEKTVLGPRVQKRQSYKPRLFSRTKTTQVLFGRHDGPCRYSRYDWGGT